MFTDIKKQVKDNFEQLSKNKEKLFYIEIDREKAWECYLEGFDNAEEKQSHNCNCCKSFIRQYGGIVTIENNKIKSIWDVEPVDKLYIKPNQNLSKYIHSLPVTDVFYNSFPKLGTDFNVATTKEGNTVQWNHFHVVLDKKFLLKEVLIDSTKGELRATKDVFKRGLDELKTDAFETVLELIAQNSLYRGKEFEVNVRKFYELKKEYDLIKNTKEKDNYAWSKSVEISTSVSRFRNTSIGTLLIDLSNGVDLDTAVSAFERVVAPTNYKRPNSLITPKMVEEAKKRLTELNLLDSLERRFATPQDLSVDNLLFVDKSRDLNDVFDELSKEGVVNPKSFNKTEEISIQDFVEKVVPKSKKIKVLLENNHTNNFISLLTAVHKDTPTLFKWDNTFSWSYTGGITDSMKERVKAAGGKVDGVLRFSIQWNEDGRSIIDLDAHALEPGDTRICYSSEYRKDRGSKGTNMTGLLDVDMINPKNTGIENIAWSDLSKMKDGNYKFIVHNFSGHKNFDGIRCEVEFNGEVHEFLYNKPFTRYLEIATVTKKGDIFTIQSNLDSKSSVNSKEVWGLKTCQFHTVKNIMLSPNYWTNQVGNKHYIFTLENCQNNESVRPFFNEFLKQELDKDRKVFEIMAGKLKVEPTKNQVSGLGFSDTQRNSIIVQVDGTFKRTLKVNF